MLLDFLFPNRCLNCNQIIGSEELVCSICYPKINFTHFDYYANNILKDRCKTLFPVENTFALMQFEENNLSRKIIHQLKYGSREKIGKTLAEWTTEQLKFNQEKPSLLTSIPLHPKKLRKRGYNQLHLFVETFSTLTTIPFDHQILRRNTHQTAQALKNLKDRNKVDHLFSVNKPLENQHILLIDDVFTTGNTLASAAWELLKHPNIQLSILVMAMDE